MRKKTIIMFFLVSVTTKLSAYYKHPPSLTSDLLYSKNVFYEVSKPDYKLNYTRFINDSSYKRYPLFIAYLPKIKYEFGSVSCIGLGVSTIDYEGPFPIWWHHGPFIETGIAFNNKDKYMCNKVGYEYFWIFFGGRANIIHYTEFQKHQFYIRPEIGLSLASYITLTYGYNFNISDNNIFRFNGSIVSFNIAYYIDKKMFRE